VSRRQDRLRAVRALARVRRLQWHPAYAQRAREPARGQPAHAVGIRPQGDRADAQVLQPAHAAAAVPLYAVVARAPRVDAAPAAPVPGESGPTGGLPPPPPVLLR